MYFIIIYLILLLTLFANIEPLKIISVIGGISFLPGLTILSLVKREDINLDDLLISFAISLGLVSVTSLAFLYMGIKIEYLLYIFYLVSGLGILKLLKGGKQINISLIKQDYIFVFITLIITCLLSLPLISERIAISAHGFHHSSIITQMMNGIFPPENPGLGGEKINYQWGYHAFIAINAVHLDLTPLRVMNIFNIISLFLIISIVYRIGILIGFRQSHAVLLIFAVFGLMRSDSIIFFLKGLITNGFGNTLKVVDALSPLDILQKWILGNGAPWFDRRMLYLSKFYNANNMPVGIFLCMAYFFVLFKIIKKEGLGSHYIIIGLILIANLMMYPPLAMFPLFHYPLLVVILLFSEGELKGRLGTLIKWGGPYVLAILIALPYLLLITTGMGEPVMNLDFWDQSIRNLMAFWLISPFLIMGFFVSVYKLRGREIKILLFSSLAVSFFLATFTRLPHWDSYKFTYILSLLYSIFFVYMFIWVTEHFTSQMVKNVFTVGVCLYLLFTPLLTETAYITSPWFNDKGYSFSGRHIIFKNDTKRNEAYQWLRENTSPKSLLILNYVATNNLDTIAQNDIYMFSAMSERNLFVVKDWYTEFSPEFQKRVLIRKKLFEDPKSERVKEFFKGLNRPVYLLIENRLPDDYIVDLSDNNIKEFDGLRLVFKNDLQSLYQLRL